VAIPAPTDKGVVLLCSYLDHTPLVKALELQKCKYIPLLGYSAVLFCWLKHHNEPDKFCSIEQSFNLTFYRYFTLEVDLWKTFYNSPHVLNGTELFINPFCSCTYDRNKD
jgi:hypothetical protein